MYLKLLKLHRDVLSVALRYVILSIHVMFEDNQNHLKRRFLVAKLYYGLTNAREIRLQTEYLTPCIVTCHKRSRSLVVWLWETKLRGHHPGANNSITDREMQWCDTVICVSDHTVICHMRLPYSIELITYVDGYNMRVPHWNLSTYLNLCAMQPGIEILVIESLVTKSRLWVPFMGFVLICCSRSVNLGIGNSGADYGTRVTAGACDQSPRLAASCHTAPVSSPWYPLPSSHQEKHFCPRMLWG